MGKLEGKVAIITGCSGGLGRHIAIRFAKEGAKIAICARSEARLQSTAQECKDIGADVLSMPVDLSDYEQLAKFVEATITRFGTVDVLVNNAVSISAPHPFLDHTLEELNVTMNSGFFATWHLMKLCFPYMKDKVGASIINFGSSAGDLGLEGYAAYSPTKEAVRALTRVAAREWGQYGIRANVISPAAVTDNVVSGVEQLPVEMKQYIMNSFSQNPMRRAGDPYSDITPVVLFIASEDSKWITGQTLYVEGGWNIHS